MEEVNNTKIEAAAAQLAGLFGPPAYIIVAEDDYAEMKLRGIDLEKPSKVLTMRMANELFNPK